MGATFYIITPENIDDYSYGVIVDSKFTSKVEENFKNNGYLYVSTKFSSNNAAKLFKNMLKQLNVIY